MLCYFKDGVIKVMLFAPPRSPQIGTTPLHISSENGHEDFVKLLVFNYKGAVDVSTMVRFSLQRLANFSF